MKIAIGSDHGGYTLKEGLKQHLANKGYDVVDMFLLQPKFLRKHLIDFH